MFENILMQASATNITNAVNQASLVATYSSLVNAIALAVGAIAPIIISIFAFVKAKSHDPEIIKAADTAEAIGKLATTISNKAVENKESIKALAELAITAAPTDIQRTLAEKQALVDRLDKEIQATTAQLKRLAPLIPGNANADTISDLPREKDF